MTDTPEKWDEVMSILCEINTDGDACVTGIREAHDKIMEWHEKQVEDLQRHFADIMNKWNKCESQLYKATRGKTDMSVTMIKTAYGQELEAKVEKLREVAKIADLMRVHLPHLEKYYQITKGMVLTEKLKQMPGKAKEALKESE